LKRVFHRIAQGNPDVEPKDYIMNERQKERYGIRDMLQKSVGYAVSNTLIYPWYEVNLDALKRLLKEMTEHHKNEKRRDEESDKHRKKIEKWDAVTRKKLDAIKVDARFIPIYTPIYLAFACIVVVVILMTMAGEQVDEKTGEDDGQSS
jgi:hypothetical protein